MFPQDFTAAAFRRKNDARIATLARVIAEKCVVALEKSADSNSTRVHLYSEADSNLVQRDQTDAAQLVIVNLKERGFKAELEVCSVSDDAADNTYIRISY